MVLEADALSIGEGEQLVVVHHTVHVLHPHRIHIAVKDEVPEEQQGSGSNSQVCSLRQT